MHGSVSCMTVHLHTRYAWAWEALAGINAVLFFFFFFRGTDTLLQFGGGDLTMEEM